MHHSVAEMDEELRKLEEQIMREDEDLDEGS
jgi:hypothetical protein